MIRNPDGTIMTSDQLNMATLAAGAIASSAVRELVAFIPPEMKGDDAARELARLTFVFDQEVLRLAMEKQTELAKRALEPGSPLAAIAERAKIEHLSFAERFPVGELDAEASNAPRKRVGHADSCDCVHCQEYRAWSEIQQGSAIGVPSN